MHHSKQLIYLRVKILALLAKDEQDPALKQQRLKEIQQRQELYKWGDNPAYSVDLPGFIEAEDPQSLPKDVQFTEEASNTLHHAKRHAIINLGLGDFFNLFDRWDHFDDYRKCFTPFVGNVPPAADSWQDDVWFGTQFLNGCNPDTIKRCTALPSHFAVTDKLVDGLMEKMSLKKAMKVRYRRERKREGKGGRERVGEEEEEEEEDPIVFYSLISTYYARKDHRLFYLDNPQLPTN